MKNFRIIFISRKIHKEESLIRETLRVHINNSIPPTHKNFQSL